MASVTVCVCEGCGENGTVRTSTVAADAGEDSGIVSRSRPTTHFVGADGVRHYLPDDWWLFELTTFGDRHIIAELCEKCAKRFADMIRGAANRLSASGARDRWPGPMGAIGHTQPKALPAKRKAPSKKSSPKKPRR